MATAISKIAHFDGGLIDGFSLDFSALPGTFHSRIWVHLAGDNKPGIILLDGRVRTEGPPKPFQPYLLDGPRPVPTSARRTVLYHASDDPFTFGPGLVDPENGDGEYGWAMWYPPVLLDDPYRKQLRRVHLEVAEGRL